MTKIYILYDGRAWRNIDDAIVLDTADTEDECREITKEKLHGAGNLWVEYDTTTEELIKPVTRADLSERRGKGKNQ